MTEIRENAYGLPIAVPGTTAETLMWAPLDEVDQMALDQLRNASTLPWVHGLRSMPDVHGGYGVPIGTVVALEQAVAPSMLGVDLSCGMNAVRTSLRNDQLPDDLHALRMAIEVVIPVGFNANTDARGNADKAAVIDRDPQTEALFTDLFGNGGSTGRFANLHADLRAQTMRYVSQCGSLGSGNHFIELCTGDDGHVWLTLHSGSRRLGLDIANHHIGIAKGLDHNAQIADPDLAVFLAGTGLMQDYLDDVWFAQDYAALNRRVMLAGACQVLVDMIPGVAFGEQISCHHNYLSMEEYDGRMLSITRKGAIAAHRGTLGLIPGSMGTGSYVVRGLGNELSYNSASHGAGRKMSRNQAKKTFTLDDLAAQTAGIECRKDAGVIDEAPGAYKSIDQVIKNESDLVEVVTRLNTVLCIKG